MEKDVDMVSKHSSKLDLDNLITDKALNTALASLKDSTDVFAKLAGIQVEQEQGLNILQNITGANKRIPSEKIRERVAHIWNNPTQLRSDDRSYNLYNLYNAVTEHLTREVEGTRYELAERVNQKVLSRLDQAARSGAKKDKLLLLPKGDTISFAE